MFKLLLLAALEEDFQREISRRDVNVKNQNGLTPLMAATANSDSEVLATRIRDGAIAPEEIARWLETDPEGFDALVRNLRMSK